METKYVVVKQTSQVEVYVETTDENVFSDLTYIYGLGFVSNVTKEQVISYSNSNNVIIMNFNQFKFQLQKDLEFFMDEQDTEMITKLTDELKSLKEISMGLDMGHDVNTEYDFEGNYTGNMIFHTEEKLVRNTRISKEDRVSLAFSEVKKLRKAIENAKSDSNNDEYNHALQTATESLHRLQAFL